MELGEKFFSSLKPNINIDGDFQSQEVPFHACDIRDDSLGKEDEMYIALGQYIFFFLKKFHDVLNVLTFL